LDCDGKRSATPLWKLYPQSKSGVAAALCHRSPNFRNWSLIGFSELNSTSDLCASASLRLCVKTLPNQAKRFLAFFSPPGLF
jgi:hypothetical protein